MPRQAPKREKPTTVKPATSKPKIKAHVCKNCGVRVGPNWRYCNPCTSARLKWGETPNVLAQVLKDIRRRRLAGKIRKGRKPNDGKPHRGGKKKILANKML